MLKKCIIIVIMLLMPIMIWSQVTNFPYNYGFESGGDEEVIVDNETNWGGSNQWSYDDHDVYSGNYSAKSTISTTGDNTRNLYVNLDFSMQTDIQPSFYYKSTNSNIQIQVVGQTDGTNWIILKDWFSPVANSWVQITSNQLTNLTEFIDETDCKFGIRAKEVDGSATLRLDDFYIGVTTLPVTLSTFTAQFVNGQAQLYWETQTEINNIGWDVYRNTEEEFSSSVQINNQLIPGHGTTTEPIEYYYTDTSLENIQNGTYWYWLQCVDLGGKTQLHGPVSMEIHSEPGQDPNNPTEPEVYGLIVSGQNPFNAASGISFAFKIEQTSNVNLSIYNIQGQLVKTIYEGNSAMESGLRWNGKDMDGMKQSAGIYLCKLKSGNSIYDVEKIILLKQ